MLKHSTFRIYLKKKQTTTNSVSTLTMILNSKFMYFDNEFVHTNSESFFPPSSDGLLENGLIVIIKVTPFFKQSITNEMETNAVNSHSHILMIEKDDSKKVKEYVDSIL